MQILGCAIILRRRRENRREQREGKEQVGPSRQLLLRFALLVPTLSQTCTHQTAHFIPRESYSKQPGRHRRVTTTGERARKLLLQVVILLVARFSGPHATTETIYSLTSLSSRKSHRAADRSRTAPKPSCERARSNPKSIEYRNRCSVLRVLLLLRHRDDRRHRLAVESAKALGDAARGERLRVPVVASQLRPV